MLHNYTFISMQQGEANCKIAPLFLSVTLFPLHLLPTQTARRASGNNCQIPRRTFAPFLACICFAIWVCVCVCVCLRASTAGCKQVPRLQHPTAAHIHYPSHSHPPLHRSISFTCIQSFPVGPTVPAGCRCIAWHSHPLETLEAHSA